jgi:hypothetical protein
MILQKAITPQLSDAYFAHGYDRVFGFVMPWGAVGWARTPAELIRAHALDFPGTPFHPDMPHVDVLRFEATGNLLLEDAVGGPDRETMRLTGGPFLDRPPFTGNGFVADPDHVVPVSWLPHHRVPAGAELHRLSADGTSRFVARFHSAARGWHFADEFGAGRPAAPRLLSRFVGGLARVGQQVHVADLVDDGTTVVLARQDDRAAADGWQAEGPGVWSSTVDVSTVDEYFELDARVRFDGLDFRIVDQLPGPDGAPVLQGSYMGHDADLAEGLRLVKLDAAVYERDLPGDLMGQAVVTQTQLPEWPGATA